MKNFGRILLRLFLALGGLILLILIYAFLAYPSEHVRRVLLWQNSDVFDYQKFPERPLQTGSSTFYFTEAPEETKVRAAFETNPTIGNLDTFLANTHTQSFIVIQNDRILYEKYFNRTKRDSIVTSFSMAKSFTSALMGIAIQEGFIQSVNDPITNYLPELLDRDPAFGKITIRDLLMMSSGIKYSEFPFLNGDDAKTYYYPDLRRLALEDTRIVGIPGKQFLYNNYHPLLLGLILERATGTSVANYLQEKIWKPLGMEFTGSWSLDSEGGFEKMESGINARAIDFAKFGRLFFNKGNWEGVQVIPAEWVAESTQEDRSINRATYYPDNEFFTVVNGYYKYMWWGMQRSENDYDFMARGDHGQYIYVSPHNKLIIVRMGEQFGIDRIEWLKIFYQFARDIDAKP
jgi:CubicO group peptidase (beta-lactamase class C family)